MAAKKDLKDGKPSQGLVKTLLDRGLAWTRERPRVRLLSIRRSDGSESSSPQVVVDELAQYWSSVFRHRPVDDAAGDVFFGMFEVVLPDFDGRQTDIHLFDGYLLVATPHWAQMEFQIAHGK